MPLRNLLTCFAKDGEFTLLPAGLVNVCLGHFESFRLGSTVAREGRDEREGSV